MLNRFDEGSRRDRVIVALDCEADKAIAIAYELAGEASWVKIGMTLYYAQKGALEGAATAGGEVPVTLGITVLTSMDQATLAQCGVERPMQDQVLALAGLTADAGISGVVASPMEAAALRAQMGPDAYIVCPGVRPAGADLGDQSRVATPAQAFDNGASHIVIGRPITDADDPVAAFRTIAASL